jgi:hypothetical protein
LSLPWRTETRLPVEINLTLRCAGASTRSSRPLARFRPVHQ